MKCIVAISCLALFLVAGTTSAVAQAANDNGCRTGGTALADAYILMNPMYAYFYGDLESYLEANSEHFQVNGDAIRCATALSNAFANTAFAVFDPKEAQEQQAMRDHLNMELGKVGLSPDQGPVEPTLSTQYMNVSAKLARMARALPAAAEGDLEPLATPANDFDGMQIWAEGMLRNLLQNPDVAWAYRQQAGLIRQSAEMEHQIILQAARKLAAMVKGKAK